MHRRSFVRLLAAAAASVKATGLDLLARGRTAQRRAANPVGPAPAEDRHAIRTGRHARHARAVSWPRRDGEVRQVRRHGDQHRQR